MRIRNTSLQYNPMDENRREGIVTILVLTCVFTMLMVPDVWSNPDLATEHPHQWLSSFSLVSGYGTTVHAPLRKTSADYEVIPILPQFGFEINSLAKKLHINTKRASRVCC